MPAKKLNITNVSVGLHHDRYALSCDYDGAHYHVWIRLLDGLLMGYSKDDLVLYKNPPVGTSMYDQGYFRTRRLDTQTKANAALIAEMVRIRDEQNLLQVAIDEEAAKQAEDERKQAVWQQQQDTIKQLKQFYQVENLEELVIQQADHVERLQALVKTTPQSVVNRVREG